MIIKKKSQKTTTMKKKNDILLILLAFISLSLFSQENELYKGVIKNDHIKGYKFVELTPNINSIANQNLSDLRILNDENKQIPYFLQEESFSVVDNFIPLKYKISFKRKFTKIIINNSDEKLFNHFTFKVSNADVNKTCKIEGSNNNKKWFVVSEKLHLSLNNNSEKSFNYYNIHFPSIQYKYIKIEINDSLSSPIHIKEIGYFNRKIIQKKTTFNKLNYTYDALEKGNTTLIHVKANRTFRINKIDFNINAPELYKRDITFYILKKRNKKEVKQIFKQLTLSSENKNSFDNLNFSHKDFWIEINNKDNQPISIESVNFFQKITYLVADLKADKTYTIIAGDKALKKPSYDLVNFKDKIKKNLSTLKIKKEEFYFKKKPNPKEKLFYEQSWFMWLSIGLVALIILGFTMSLMKQSKEM